jgi:hypothetical protein
MCNLKLRATHSRFGLPIRTPVILEGITTFKVPEGSSSEDILINQLDTIDLHHWRSEKLKNARPELGYVR